jgi:hypothetical protein
MNARKKAARIGLAVCLTWLLLAGAAATAQMSAKMGREKMPRDGAEASQWAQDALAKSGYRVNKIDSQYILYGNTQGDYGIALARVVSTSAEYSGGYTWRVFWQDYAHENREAMEIAPRQLERFKGALDFLAANARQEASERDEQELAQFQAQAKAWREAAVKPTMPEQAREHQVLAEFAFKEKDVDKAINQYLAALSVFPAWPEGQYNLATLAGEKKFYVVATLHMKEYLELMPDSPDAQAAKDSIIIWRDKLQTVLASSTVNAEPQAGQRKGGFLQVKDKQKNY